MAFCQGVAQELFTVPIWIIEIASNNSFSTQSDSTAWRASDISLPKGWRLRRVRYGAAGTLFGVAFPVVATAVDLLSKGLPWSWQSVAMLHRTQPLLWIIDTAPFILGFFSVLIGRRADALHLAKRTLEERVYARTMALEEAKGRAESAIVRA
jgi:hypothetical protein